MSKPTYRVTAYRTRGTAMFFDLDDSARAPAVKAFDKLAREHVDNPDVCVLLTTSCCDGSGIVLADKSTGADRVVYHRAFFGK